MIVTGTYLCYTVLECLSYVNGDQVAIRVSGKRRSRFVAEASLWVSSFHIPIISSLFQALLEHNAKVYMASRSPDRAQGAIQQLRDETGKEALYLHLDLADLTSVRKSADEFLS